MAESKKEISAAARAAWELGFLPSLQGSPSAGEPNIVREWNRKFWESKQDKTAVQLLPIVGLPLPMELDKTRRTFPINNKYHFHGKRNPKEVREEVLRVIKDGNVKASPVDMDGLKEARALYPDEEDVYLRDLRLKNFKQKFYRNNPEWEAEERDWKRRKEEAGFE